jgi:hypothetical protein
MAVKVAWDDVEPPKISGGGGGGRFLRLEANKAYLLRPVGKPIKYYQWGNEVNGKYRTAIVDDPDKSTVAPRHPNLKRAQERRAFLAYHRDDGNTLKFVDLPATALEPFKMFKKVAQIDPSDANEGGLFQLTVVSPTGKKDRQTKYALEFKGKAPVTAEEKQFYIDHKDSYNLEEQYKGLSDEEIEKRLFDPNWEFPKKGDASKSQQGDEAKAAVTAGNENFQF